MTLLYPHYVIHSNTIKSHQTTIFLWFSYGFPNNYIINSLEAPTPADLGLWDSLYTEQKPKKTIHKGVYPLVAIS